MESHCVKFGVSDPCQKLWSAVGECYPELYSDDCDNYTESCAFCDSIVTLFKVLTGLLSRMQPHIPPVKFNQHLFKLRRSEYDVNFFKGYQMRKMVSRKAWQILKEQ